MQQLGLFDDGTLRLQRVRRVLLESLDLESAADELTHLLRRGPNPDAEPLAAAVAELEDALAAEATGGARDLVTALLRLEPVIPDWLRAGWHRRLTLEAEQAHGVGCRIGTETSGWHLLRAGDLRDAERSLRATLRQEPGDARSRAHLADALHLLGQSGAARLEYRRALVDAPDAVEWAALADPEIAALPAIARHEHEVPGSPQGWAAAVGTIETLLPWPTPHLPAIGPPPATGSPHPGLAFYRLLCAEHGSRTLAEKTHLRREMKALCPSVLAAYLERRS
jgi:tetratricopeptide (TPR) repeat protein